VYIFLCSGVLKFNGFGVEQHGIMLECFFPEFILFVAAMGPIPYYWMEDMGKVPSNLMHSSCLWLC
jgi:hypothetical protein